MAITYEEALGTLKSMFSDQGYTPQQLDAVLRHHGGHMEHTVETLLSHGEGTPDELIRKLPGLPPGGTAANAGGGGGGDAAAHNIDADEELARQLAAEDERQQRRGRPRSANQTSGPGTAGMFGGFPGQQRPQRPAASAATAPKPTRPAVAARPKPPAGTKGRGVPTALPDDFLRIPGRKYPVPSAASDGAADPVASATGPGGAGQMMTDEQLARMLQDELFQEELRNNPEFSHLAGRRNPSARSAVGPGGRRVPATNVQATGRSQHAGVGWGERTDFFDRLSELGDNAKRRFQQLAANWNDPAAQANRRALFGGVGGGGGGGGRRPAAPAGNERRGLLSGDLNMEEEEEEEMEFVGSAGSGRSNTRDYEMNDVGSGSRVSWSGDKKKD